MSLHVGVPPCLVCFRRRPPPPATPSPRRSWWIHTRLDLAAARCAHVSRLAAAASSALWIA
eukprot:9324721-Alexandrium_andersonii.AAC.1